MHLWPYSVRQPFLGLAPHAAVAGPLCRAAATGAFSSVTRLRDICASAGIAEARSSAIETALSVGAAHGLFTRCSPTDWRSEAGPFAELAMALEAVSLYRDHVHVDIDIVQVVLTPPGKPSQLGDSLRAFGWAEAELEHTESILRHLAMRADERFVVLSPFLDTVGTEHLIALFKVTQPHVKRVLVTRCQGGNLSPALQVGMPAMLEMGVVIHNYWLPRAWGYETFHAKVLLADAKMAYLGSANMTQASLSLSMELGTLLTGRSVKSLVTVVDSILAIAPRLS